MARLTKEQSAKKQFDGKQLYIQGVEMTTIASTLNIHIDTVKSWSQKNEWEKAKEVENISVDGLKKMLYETVTSIKNGETPKVKPDELSKIIKAFETLSGSKTNLMYMMSNFTVLSKRLLLKVSEEKISSNKKELMNITQYVQKVMDEIVGELSDRIRNE